MQKTNLLSAALTVTLVSTALICAPATARAKGKAKHVVVLVWDGMRRDYISPQYTPHLYELATNGVFFKKHHPVGAGL
jgi:predicted AlkP superfamily pyrophosphatase or phosphodiesterase